MKKCTYVTAVFELYKNGDPLKSQNFRIQCFEKIANSGVNIVLFCCPIYKKLLENIEEKFPNVKILEVLELEELKIAKICAKYNNLELPNNRNLKKDTKEYMILINSKVEFLKKAIESNYWNTNHFMWIDFSIAHIFSNYENTFSQLKHYNPKNEITIPGCWKKGNYNFTDNIVWRFCGGILAGDAESLNNFYNIYMEQFCFFLENYKKIVWEVNFWYWLEINNLFYPKWIAADHNDSIILNLLKL